MQRPNKDLYFIETTFISRHGATIKDVPTFLSKNNFESTYILFKFFPDSFLQIANYSLGNQVVHFKKHWYK